MTRQRKIILDTLRQTKSHPTADWVYEQVRKECPDISLGTVYRNLGILKEAGDIMELSYGSTYSRYDGNPANHYHFVCADCGRVLDLDMPVVADLDRNLVQQGYEVGYHRLEFYGRCRECKAVAETRAETNMGT
ncbi:MAG: transcriptional repressor [Clostridia bacterium]|nr:MAG: transcriptional repressor [Clostridia bacterium]